MPKDGQLRVRKNDPLNWVLERYLPEGVYTRGRKKGEVRPAEWEVVGWYGNSLVGACRAALDEEIAIGWTGDDVLGEVERALDRVAEMVAERIVE